MTIKVYAALKDYFDKEFEIKQPLYSIHELSEVLATLNPEAKNMLAVCRFAVNDHFVDNHFQLQLNDSIDIIPPSSGG